MKTYLQSILGSIYICCLVINSSAQAQISTDGTLPTNINQVGKIYEITGGTQAGINLFHSFKEFSVPTGSEAFFKNITNINNVNNIINRVTGGSISQIDGLIKENYGANFILINPNGIHFGPNAQLNIGGSFLGSTASSLKFADGTEFSATDSQIPPLLTISVPIGLQFGQNPGTIRVQGTGHDFTIRDAVFSPVERSLHSSGLQVQSGQTLALVGGNISLEGGLLTAPGGHVELGSVAQGFVSLNPTLNGWILGYEGTSAFKDIEMRSQALVDTSGVSGGSIQAQGQNLSISDGSLILNQNQGTQPAGAITINTSESLSVKGTNADGSIRTSVINQTVGLGRGGDINISSPELIVEGGADIVATTFSSAVAGDITVNASDVQILGASPLNPRAVSAISTATLSSGNAGDATLFTERLIASGGGILASSTLGTGNGGNLNVTATDSIEIVGVEPNLLTPSAVTTATLGAGNAGNLTVNTAKLSVRDGGRIDASTFATGDGGSLTIKASELVEVKGTVPGAINPSLISSAANVVDPSLQQAFNLPPIPSGTSGNLTIETNQLKVSDSAIVTARNDGFGNSGNVSITAGSILLDSRGSITSELGRNSVPSFSSRFSGMSSDSRQGGDITIFSEDLVIKNGAGLSTATFTNTSGGNININVSGSVQVIGFSPFNPTALSFISSSTFGSAAAGNVNLSAGQLTILDGGRVGAATFGFGSGGDVTINTTEFVKVIGAEPSLLAPSLVGVSAFNRGNAGNLTINTPQVLIQDGGRLDSSTVAAGSAGSITVNAPQSVEVSGTIPGTSVSSLISAGANIENEFTRQLFRLPPVPSGSSGELTINTGRLIVQDRAVVTARNQGSGNAGNATVNARSILVNNSGSITAATQSGEGGNVILKTGSIQMRQGSQISAEAGGTGNGGNVIITGYSPTDFVVLLEGSRITANAFQGQGGNIQINTQGLFVCPECQITASSELGFDGVVEIITPDTESNQEAIALPQEIALPEEVVAQACSTNRAQERSELTISGRGGLPPRPNEPLSSEALVSFEPLPHAEMPQKKPDVSQLPLPAQGWYVNPKGTVILTANAPTVSPFSPGLSASSCHAN